MKRYIATCHDIKNHYAFEHTMSSLKKALNDGKNEAYAEDGKVFTVYELKIEPIAKFKYRGVMEFLGNKK